MNEDIGSWIMIPCPICGGYTIYRDAEGREYCSDPDCLYEKETFDNEVVDLI